jgi:hypothetical protein
MNTNVLTLVNSALPSFSGSRLTYNEKKNIILTEGYTSAAGNTYFQGIRMSDRIVISYQFGQGYCYLFLNGIRIYAYNGKELQLISQDFFNCNIFSEDSAKRHAIGMVKNYLSNQAAITGRSVEQRMIEEMATSLVYEAQKDQVQIAKLMSHQ